MPRQRQQARILVVDDDRLMRAIARDALAGLARVEACDGVEAAVAALEREPADLVLSDLVMSGRSGLELLEFVRREHPESDFVLLTGNASVESAVEALRMGATDYLTKPVAPDELELVVDRILANRRLQEENSRLRGQLETLDACQSLMSCLDAGQVFAVTLDLLLSALNSDRGVAVFRRPGLPTADGVAFRGFAEAEARRLRDALAVEKSLGLEAFEAPQRVTHGTLHDALQGAGVSCPPAMAVPLRGRDMEQGLIWIFEPEGGFGAAADSHAQLVRERAELALQNAERYGRAKERAFIDDVTEVYNARFLLQATDREIERAGRYGRELSVLFLDLDRFKLVNDRYGHLVGSSVLRQLSGVLRDCVRSVDTLARYGGDEFTILLVDSDLAQAMEVAERIRGTVATTPFDGSGSSIRLSISIGVATFPQHGRTRDQLLDVADKAMYRAKSNGRDCVVSAAELE
ncbi:MAG: diguanylate cyclase [Deltaproteobacteria bacterium]|nr:diguanylate cyclase [Deltaproteobacteria bacterium]MBW2360348.1 diguanylate cyclase [Deltaproteobacteria bacterium]